MRSTLPLLLAFVLVLATVAVAGGEDPSARPLAIGETVPTFSLEDLAGDAFDLATAREIDETKALASVRAAVKAAGATLAEGDVAETTLASLSGLAGEDGALDTDQVQALARTAGTRFGLIPAADVTADFETIGDVVEWITDSAEAPLVFMCWSPMCPTSRRYEQRLQDAVAQTGARFFPLASSSSAKESDDDTRTYVAQRELPYRVLLDREQKACDIFGGLVTPHVFVIDAEGRLAYAGAIDSDPRFKTESADERQNWLADALEALASDSPMDVMLTRAKG